jgi:hypothetical protein
LATKAKTIPNSGQFREQQANELNADLDTRVATRFKTLPPGG